MKVQNPGDGRQRILDAAEAMFTERGFKAVSIRDIAHACKMTNAALYYHFPNKAALFSEVMEHHVKSLREQMRQAGEGIDDARARMIAMLAKYAVLTAEHRSAFFSFRREAKALEHSRAHEHGGRLVQVILEPLEEVIHQAVESGELRPLPEGYSPASLLVGMVHGLEIHRKSCCQENITPEDIRMIVDIFWDGLSQPQKVQDIQEVSNQ